MISKPTTPQLIDAVCAALEGTVAPVLDGVPRDTLEKAIGILKVLSVRAAHEIAWMREESDEIVALAGRFVDELPDTAALTEALAALAARRDDSLSLADVQASYELAGEVLSRAVECAYRSGSRDHIADATRTVEQRIVHQDLTIGTFEAAGRT